MLLCLLAGHTNASPWLWTLEGHGFWWVEDSHHHHSSLPIPALNRLIHLHHAVDLHSPSQGLNEFFISSSLMDQPCHFHAQGVNFSKSWMCSSHGLIFITHHQHQDFFIQFTPRHFHYCPSRYWNSITLIHYCLQSFKPWISLGRRFWQLKDKSHHYTS